MLRFYLGLVTLDCELGSGELVSTNYSPTSKVIELSIIPEV